MKKEKELNPTVKSGDRIMCLEMDNETSVPMGTKGTVLNVVKDPFGGDDDLIAVNWDNGSKLSLVVTTDKWVKDFDTQIKESQTGDRYYDYFSKNPEVFDNFDWRFFRDFLYKLRESSVVNMFQAGPFLYSGKEWIDRYHGEHQEDNESFQEVLEMAEESKNKMVQGIIKYMTSKNLDLDDMSKVNHYASKFADKIVQLYMTFA
jgi:hypothetical protein